jgi:hemerythrin-like domain-containing protein
MQAGCKPASGAASRLETYAGDQPARQPREGIMTTTPERVDTQEMVIVHRPFRREFRMLPALVQQVPAGDLDRADIVAGHAADLTFGLHHHHTAEDLLLWPKLLARAAPRAELVHRMQAQHERLGVLLDRIDVLSARWRPTADPATRDELAHVLAQTSAALDEHLGDEENEILPLVAEHITVPEWDALTAYGKKVLPKNSKAFVFLGLILEETTATERVAFLRRMPIPLRWAWRLIGHRIYRRAMTRLRTTPGGSPRDSASPRSKEHSDDR